MSASAPALVLDDDQLDQWASSARQAIARLLALVVEEPDISDIDRPDDRPTPRGVTEKVDGLLLTEPEPGMSATE